MKYIVNNLFALTGLVIASAMFHVYIVPPRWGFGDIVVLLFIMLGILLSGTGGSMRSRFIIGAIQAAILLYTYSNTYRRDLILGDRPNAALVALALFVISYIFVFTYLANKVAAWWNDKGVTHRVRPRKIL